jgi:hypothetical protein
MNRTRWLAVVLALALAIFLLASSALAGGGKDSGKKWSAPLYVPR